MLYCIVFYCKYFKQHNKLMAASFARIRSKAFPHDRSGDSTGRVKC